MPKIRIDRLAFETFGRVFGVKALLEALDRALPEAEWQQREELKRLAEEQNWEYDDYDVERQVLDEKFRRWIPRFAAYSVIALLHAVVEDQLFACAARLRTRRVPVSPAGRKKRRGLDRARQQLKAVSGFDVASDSAWPVLMVLEKMRNLVVHHAGAPDTAEDVTWLAKLARAHSGKVSVSEDSSPYQRHILLSMRYCDDLAAAAEGFFKSPACGGVRRQGRLDQAVGRDSPTRGWSRGAAWLR
jgi:hypothetical protein